MKWVLRLVLVPVTLAVVVFGVGTALPQDHLASVRATIPASPEDVHARIVDVGEAPSWRSDLSSVEVIAQSPLRWREDGEYGVIEYALEENRADLVVARIVGDRNDFGGLWRYRIEPAGPGTTVTIVEEGEVYSALFRFFGRFVFGHHGTMESYLRDLGSSFGATVTTEQVR